jgi:hypothetical protein
VTISDWAGADGARFETGGAQRLQRLAAQLRARAAGRVLAVRDPRHRRRGRRAARRRAGSAAGERRAGRAGGPGRAGRVDSRRRDARDRRGDCRGRGGRRGRHGNGQHRRREGGGGGPRPGADFPARACCSASARSAGSRQPRAAAGAAAAAAAAAPSSSAAPSAPTGLALAAASDSGTTGDNVTSDTTPTISGRGDAGSSIEVRNAAGTTIATATVDSAGNWTATPSNALADGSQALQVVANRGTGTTASAATPIHRHHRLDRARGPGGPPRRGLRHGRRRRLAHQRQHADPVGNRQCRRHDPRDTARRHGADHGGRRQRHLERHADHGARRRRRERFRHRDRRGGQRFAGVHARITIDTTAPGAPTLAVPEGPVVNAAENADGIQANVSGSFVAGDTVSVLVTRPDATTTTVTRTVNAAEATAGVVALTVPSQTVQGGYTLRAIITDAAGNAGAASAPVALTLASSGLPAPTLAIPRPRTTSSTPPRPPAAAARRSPSRCPTGTAAGSTVALVLAVPNAAAVTINYTVTGADATAGSATVLIPNANIAANGAYSLVGTVTDPNGNAGAPSVARAFTVDRTVVAPGAPDLAPRRTRAVVDRQPDPQHDPDLHGQRRRGRRDGHAVRHQRHHRARHRRRRRRRRLVDRVLDAVGRRAHGHHPAGRPRRQREHRVGGPGR